MAGNATIGALRVVLGLESATFTEGLSKAQVELRKAGARMQSVGAAMEKVGGILAIGITAPVVALGASALKASANFQTAMNKVSISTQATAKEMGALETAARQIGKSTVFSASEAADAMDMLAKTGLDVQTILGGAAKAAVDLAAAAGSELEPAASAISDSIQQFKRSSDQLPATVNQITGAVNQSKLSFDDYALALGQAGGVAAGLGVSFEDFNAAIAGTSALFSSGSDAGTSFKTFLTTLVPKSKDAAAAMQQYGLSFFDAGGRMKSVSDIAEMLREKLGGLSDEAKNEVLKDIFGTDAMRTALGLMDLGAQGLDKIKQKIAETDAAAQAAKRMEGFAGQMEQLRWSFEDLGIAIGKAGLLQAATALVSGLTGLLEKLSEADPVLLKVGVAVAAAAAAFGAAVLVGGAFTSALGSVISAMAVVGPMLAGLVPLLGPVGLAVAAVVAAFLLFKNQIVPALKVFWTTLQDVVGPKVAPLFEAVKGAVAALGEVFGLIFGPGAGGASEALNFFAAAAARYLGGVVDLLTGMIGAVTHVVQAIVALFKGDFSGAFEHVGRAVQAFVKGVSNAFGTMYPEVAKWVQQTFLAVKTWLVDKLTAIFDSVKKKVQGVSDAFFKMYDAVVGHSYVPDMVEEVGDWFDKLGPLMVEPAASATDAVAQSFREAADDVSASVDGLFRAFKNKDWVGAISGIEGAIAGIKKAYAAGKAMTGGLGSQANGIAGGVGAAAGAVAPYVGGVGGSVLSGVALGAQLGSIVPGIGTAIGAVVGGIGGLIGGLFGKSKAKKKAKKEAEAKAKAEAEQKAAQEAATKRALEIQLLEASGDALGAEAALREEVLKGMSAENAALQKEIWAKQDAQKLVDQQRALELEMLEALGDAQGALALQRQDELKAITDEGLRARKQAIYDVIDATAAREAAEADWAAKIEASTAQVEAATDAATDQLEKTAERFDGLAESLADLNASLRAESLATSPASSLAASKRQFDNLASRVSGGDATALDGLGAAAKAFADASRGGAASSAENARNMASIRRALTNGEALAKAQAAAARTEIDALNSMVEGQLGIRLGVKAVEDRVLDVVKAVQAAAAVQAQANGALAAVASQVAAAVQAASSAASATNISTPVVSVDPASLVGIDVAAAQATVAGLGGSEAVDLSAAGMNISNADVVAALAKLTIATEQGVVNTGNLRYLRLWNGDGMPEIRDVA